MTTYRFQVQFTDGAQKEFRFEATSLDAALADVRDAHQMDCTLTGVFEGFTFEEFCE